jgi:drug/metabolite transporter (DMT)-like permease
LSLTVSFAVLLAALLHASWNAMIKGGNDVLLDTAAIVAGAGLVALPFVFLVPLPAAASWPYILASVATHVAYYYLMINAYRSGELSLVYPLMRGVAPLLTGVIAIFWMDEWPGTVGWIGMAMISLGVIALALRPARLGAALHGHGRAVGFALANAGVIALYTIIDGSGARIAGNAWSYIVWLFVLDAIPFTGYMLATRGSTFAEALVQRRTRGLIGGGLSAAAYAISVWAMTKAPVALVASLRETSVLFATLIGARLLKEHLTPRRWAGVGAVIVGVFALKLA